VWHCHILSHEENDMMRAITLNVVSGVPGSPSPLAVDDTGASPVLTWTDATPVNYQSQAFFGDQTNEIAFRIERTADVGGPVTTMYALANTSSYTDTTATPGAYYRYRVVAYNEAGEAASNFVEIRAAASSTAADSVTLTANPASGFVQLIPGTPVVFTAQGVGGSGSYEYQFTVNGTVVQPYAPTATYTLAAGMAAGTYTVRVDVRTSAASASDASDTMAYVVAVPATAGLGLTAAPATSPVFFGTPVVFTAAGTGSTGYQYRFSQSTDNVTFTMVQDWGTVATWTLAGTTPPGTYYVKAEVRTNLSGPDASQVVSTVVQYRPATTLILRSSTASPFQLSNPPTTVTFLALGGGSTGTPALGYQYRFSLSSDNNTFNEVQAYSTKKLWTLPGDTAPGTYYLRAEVTTNPAGGVADKVANMTFTVLPGADPATDLLLSASLDSPQYAGTAVTFTAAASGGTPQYYYRFLLSSDGVNFNEVRASNATATWALPVNTAAGDYTVKAEVRTNPFKVTPDVSATMAYQVLPVTPAATLTISANASSPQLVGATVIFTAAATGGGPVYYYRFSKSTDGGATYTLAQDYSTQATYALDTSVAANYRILAEVRTSTQVNRDLSDGINFEIRNSPATGVSLQFSPATSAVINTVATLTATATAAVPNQTFYYKFWRSTDGGATWTVAQAQSTTATHTINTAAAGTFRYMVEATTNPATAREAVASSNYSVVVPAATSVTLTTNVPSPQVRNTPVQFTATGGSNVAGLTFEYRFWYSTNGGVTYTLGRAYSTTNTYDLDTSAPGTYRVLVDCRTVGRTNNRDVTATRSFTVN